MMTFCKWFPLGDPSKDTHEDDSDTTEGAVGGDNLWAGIACEDSASGQILWMQGRQLGTPGRPGTIARYVAAMAL